MPKRVHRDDNLDYFRKKLRKLEKQLNRSRKRSRIIESSSSESSRDSSPTPLNQQDGTQDNATTPDSPPLMESCSYDLIDPAPDAIDAGPSTSSALINEVVDTSTVSVDPSPNEDSLNSILLDILGEDPAVTEEYGPEIHKDLATRFNYIATTGLDPKTRKELTSKYLIPINSTRISSPLLNAEIKAALPETMQKRDKQLEYRQKQIATVIACLSSVMSDQLSADPINQDLLKKLMDAARLLCDIQHTDSNTRRNFALFSLKKDMKEHLCNTTVDKFLFGENLAETLRTAKAVNKSSTDLKVQNKVTKKPFTQTKPHGPKNWKAPTPAGRPPGPARSRAPAPPPPPPPPPPRSSRPAPQSKRSSPPPRHTRRR